MKVIKALFFGLILTPMLVLNGMIPPPYSEYERTTPIPGVADDEFDVEAQLPAASPRRVRRRQSICLLTTSNEGRLVPEDPRQQRRISLALSAIDNDEPIGEQTIPALNLSEENLLTTQLQLEVSPRERDSILRAIEDIQEEQDPLVQARKSTTLLVNLHMLNTQKNTTLMNEGSESLQVTLADLKKGIQELKATEQAMLSTQMRLRKMAYIGYFFGFCSLGFFIYNTLTSHDTEQQ